MQQAAATLGDCFDGRWVIKPRDGAGSEGLLVLPAKSAEELRQRLATMDEVPTSERFMVQPLILGQPFSRCVVVDRGGHRHWLPLMTQDLSADFKYQGGKVVQTSRLPQESWDEMSEVIGNALAGRPLAGTFKAATEGSGARARVHRAMHPNTIRLDIVPPSEDWCNALLDALGGGELGWLGLDLLLTSAGDWIAIECNPRCTTSMVYFAGAKSPRLD